MSVNFGASVSAAPSTKRTMSLKKGGPSLGTITPAVGCRSSCGNQAKSTLVSRPSYGFGTSDREDRAKRFISQEHTKTEAVMWTPGPGAYNNDKAPTTKRQAESTIKNTAMWGFGTQSRFGTTQMSDRKPSVPGPGAYFT